MNDTMDKVEKALLIDDSDLTDASNADFFADAYRGTVAFCDALGWLFYDGKRWTQNEHKVTEAALLLTDGELDNAITQYSKALVAAGGDFRDSYVRRAENVVKHWRASRSANRIQGMLALAKSKLVVDADELDADSFILNTPSGEIDLKTGEIHPHDWRHWCTRITKCGPMKNTEDEVEGYRAWWSFLDKVACGDFELIQFLQTVAGMALIGAVYHEGIVILLGGGRNGKSTFTTVITSVLDDYAGGIDSDVLIASGRNKGAAMATLRGKRLVIASELEEGQRLSASILKKLASTDRIVIEEKYRQPATVKQTHTLVLHSNFLPRVGSTDNGTWRRICVCPFNAVIPATDAVQNFADVLVEKAGPQILSWMVQGAQMFIANEFKLVLPAAVLKATDEYRTRENWLVNFLDENTVKDANGRSGARDLYEVYRSWAINSNEYVRREVDFSAAMAAAGYTKRRMNKGQFYLGVKLSYSERTAAAV